ncbi:DHA1 family tetracycline resistance protein-like MFS transporter [Oxalobacteraceae bacterium GrIS 1.11]
MKTVLLIGTAGLLALLSTIGASLPFPILPPLFALESGNQITHFLGLPPKLLFGLALMINPLGLLIGSAVMGPLSDRYGRRPLLLATSIGAALGHALTAAALLMQSYPLFILARFGTGLLEGNGAVARALLADRLSGPLRMRALSCLNGAFYLGWLAGPLLAGFTLHWGIAVPFAIAVAALLLVAVLVALLLPPESASTATTSWWQVARDRHALNLLRDGPLRSLFMVHLTYCCGVTAFYEYYALWLVEVAGYDARGIAWVNTGLCLSLTVSALFAGGASRFDPLRRAAFHACCGAAAVALVALGNVQLGLLAIVLFGIPNAFYNAVMQNWCVERFDGHGRGAVLGLLSTAFCLANIIMALAGSVLTLFDTRLVLLLGALLSAGAGWRILGWRARMGASGVATGVASGVAP